MSDTADGTLGTPFGTDGTPIKEALAQLQISRRTLYRRIKSGELHSYVKDGMRYVVVPAVPKGVPSGTQNATFGTPGTPPAAQEKQESTASAPVTGEAALIDQLRSEIADLRDQRDAWRLQSEAANRTANEAMAELRAMRKEKALPAATEAPPATQTGQPATNTPTPAPQNDAPAATETAGGAADLEQPGTQKRESVSTNAAKPRPRERTLMARLMRRISGQ